MPISGAVIVPHPPIILPEIGRGETEKISKTIQAYQQAAGFVAGLRPDTLVVTSPHTVMYADYFHISPGEHARGDFGAFGAAQASIEADYDAELVREITKAAGELHVPAGTLGEKDASLDHGTLVPLRFINDYLASYKLVRIGLSGLTPLVHYRLGQCIARAAAQTGRRVAIVASGDLSHRLTHDGPYGYAPEGPLFDERITRIIREADFYSMLTLDDGFCDRAAECGLRSFQIMAGAFDGVAVEPRLLSYEGPFGVGYGVGTFEPLEPDESRRFGERLADEQRKTAAGFRDAQDDYVRLARESLETYVRTGKRAALPEDVSPELLSLRAGVFVSLKAYGRLRGCIGTISPVTANVAEEILRNAISAGREDPRFEPVREAELDTLIYSVDVLTAPEKVDSPDSLDPARYGVIVSGGSRRGLLLPRLDGVDTVERQIDIARQKAGIGPDEPFELERFEVVRHK